MREEPRTTLLPLALLSLLVCTCFCLGTLCSQSIALAGPSAAAVLAEGTPPHLWTEAATTTTTTPTLRGDVFFIHPGGTNNDDKARFVSYGLVSKKLLLLGLLLPSFLALLRRSDGDEEDTATGSQPRHPVTTEEPYGRRPGVAKRSDTHLYEMP